MNFYTKWAACRSAEARTTRSTNCPRGHRSWGQCWRMARSARRWASASIPVPLTRFTSRYTTGPLFLTMSPRGCILLVNRPLTVTPLVSRCLRTMAQCFQPDPLSQTPERQADHLVTRNNLPLGRGRSQQQKPYGLTQIPRVHVP